MWLADLSIVDGSGSDAWRGEYWQYEGCWSCGFVQLEDRIEFDRVEVGERVAVELAYPD